MNKRINELAEQAAEKHGHTIKFTTEITETLDTFAELIVRECCDKFIDMQHKFHPSICVYEIKKHFGVK